MRSNSARMASCWLTSSAPEVSTNNDGLSKRIHGSGSQIIKVVCEEGGVRRLLEERCFVKDVLDHLVVVVGASQQILTTMKMWIELARILDTGLCQMCKSLHKLRIASSTPDTRTNWWCLFPTQVGLTSPTWNIQLIQT